MDYKKLLVEVLQSAREKKYRGYEKFDALNSPAVRFLCFGNPWLRLFWTQAVKECAFHVRPLLGVRQTRNAKGIALFIRAYLSLYEQTGLNEYLNEAVRLGEWLLENPSPGQKHLSWGYSFDWQDVPPFFQKQGEPNIVVTCFAGEAFVHLLKHTTNQRFLEALNSVALFVTRDVPVLFESEHERAISYLLSPVPYIVLNTQVMSGALLAKIARILHNQEFLDLGRKQVAYTINRRTEEAAWFYTEPRNKSPIRHDNYHTGGILDNLLDYMEASGESDFLPVYRKGLEYYSKNLFEDSGAPRWMNDRRYPRDVHGAAQGIISFSKASVRDKSYREKAAHIASWAVQNLYRAETRDFMYRRGRFLRYNYSLVRWCNAWMARALGELIGARG